ncbi:TPA: hypothetical protein RRH03_001517 [Klebsiella pneumoniae]|uniref:hypothetical protein n=1 Tax=Klebsiella TaxID=570 RepID=UPI000CD10BA0|nr:MULTISPECIES: hypothetical protein [Klebsiella]AUU95526.1 hypothetical protein C2U49_12315 [Klebsiella pneumoniae]EKV4191568.1 hypothetical protein [Klebsiella michiganensis]ELI6990271.1 hypothetical protein [Klebsiella pneumoniae]MCK2101476.1 hypothetical protein [Klebsiella michiganensis]MEA5437723.1 hypothetical protein [Klebsiella variicola]
MMLLNIDVFERLALQRLATIAEVVNSLYGLHPATKINTLNEDAAEEIKGVRQIISRNIKSLGINVSGVNEEMNADLLFSAASEYMRDGITPPAIVTRGKESLSTLAKTNKWEEYMYAFGGRSLVEEVSAARKTGRGQHRKTDEEAATLKMMGLLIKMLAQKQTGQSYGTVKKPNVAAIYRDLTRFAEDHNIDLKGVSKATFAAKARTAIHSAIVDD